MQKYISFFRNHLQRIDPPHPLDNPIPKSRNAAKNSHCGTPRFVLPTAGRKLLLPFNQQSKINNQKFVVVSHGKPPVGRDRIPKVTVCHSDRREESAFACSTTNPATTARRSVSGHGFSRAERRGFGKGTASAVPRRRGRRPASAAEGNRGRDRPPNSQHPSPGRETENSPALQRRVTTKKRSSPGGTAEILSPDHTRTDTDPSTQVSRATPCLRGHTSPHA